VIISWQGVWAHKLSNDAGGSTQKQHGCAGRSLSVHSHCSRPEQAGIKPKLPQHRDRAHPGLVVAGPPHGKSDYVALLQQLPEAWSGGLHGMGLGDLGQVAQA